MKGLWFKFEDWIWWRLNARWRRRATIDQIESHQQWLNLDLWFKRRGLEY